MNGHHMLHHTVAMMNGLVVNLQGICRVRFPRIKRRVVPGAVEIVRFIGTNSGIFLFCYIGRPDGQSERQ